MTMAIWLALCILLIIGVLYYCIEVVPKNIMNKRGSSFEDKLYQELHETMQYQRKDWEEVQECLNHIRVLKGNDEVGKDYKDYTSEEILAFIMAYGSQETKDEMRRVSKAGGV